MVSILIENPSAASTPKVPSNTTGTAMVGMRVARKFWRNRYITRKTSTTASSKVSTTLLIEARTNGVVSNGTAVVRPAGKLGWNSLSLASTARAVVRALAPVASDTPTPAAGLPLKREITS